MPRPPQGPFRSCIGNSSGGACFQTPPDKDYRKSASLFRRQHHQHLAPLHAGIGLDLGDLAYILRHALEKYRKKNLDYIVLNTPRTFAADRMDCRVYKDGAVLKRFKGATKAEVARWIVGRLAP